MNPEYPVYIVSKGRYDVRLTADALDSLGVFYRMVIERQEYDRYAEHVPANQLLVMPDRCLAEYNTCDDRGDELSKGPGAARNYCWDHAVDMGAKRHWVLDDNIRGFVRLNHNQMSPVATGAIFKAAEDFVDRYTNVALAGFEYRFFGGGQRRQKPPFRLNNRIYSCLLVQNDIPYEWRGRYNEDTDLSLQVLQDGWVTMMFHAFLCNKAKTQTMSGGNTAAFYDVEGTLNKSQMIVDLYPDIAKVVKRYGRWHHQVDYSRYAGNELIKVPNLHVPKGINNYGMKLVPQRSIATNRSNINDQTL